MMLVRHMKNCSEPSNVSVLASWERLSGRRCVASHRLELVRRVAAANAG